MIIGRRNRSTRRKPASLLPSRIPHGPTWDRTRPPPGGKPATDCPSYGTAYCM
jgi:hypothetical protein